MFAGLTTTKQFPFITRPVGQAASPDGARISQRTARSPRRRLLLMGVGMAMLVLAFIIPAASVGAASAYPPNTVISTYFDGRYGEVSVVTDSSGNLIDINALTGQRIYPIYPDYPTIAGYTSVVPVNGYTTVPTNAYAYVPANTYVPANAYVPVYRAG